MCEILVEVEPVLVHHLLPPGHLLQHPRLSARQRLQRPPQLPVLDPGRLLDLLEAEVVGLVKRAEDERLEEGDFELLVAGLEGGAEDAVAEVGLPLELAARVLAVIELGEDVLQAKLVKSRFNLRAAHHSFSRQNLAGLVVVEFTSSKPNYFAKKQVCE